MIVLILQIQKMAGYNAYFGCFSCRIAGVNFGHIYFPTPDDPDIRRKQLKLRDSKKIKIFARSVNIKFIQQIMFPKI